MNVKLRVILITMSISLLVWAVCTALALMLFRQMAPAIVFTYNTVLLIVFTFIIVLAASLAVGIIMSRTISQRRKAFNELKESKERLRTLSEATVEGIIIHDGNIFLEANDISAKMLGSEPSDLLGKLVTDFIAPESLELVKNNIRAGYSESYEITIRRKDGTTFPAEFHGKDTTYNGQKVRIDSMRDLTLNKKMQAELRMQAELLDASTDSILMHDFQGNFLYVNKAACKSHGYTRDELIKINLHNMEVQKYARIIKTGEEELTKKDTVTFESAHYRKDGSILPLEIHARIFKWGDKEYILSVGRDITDRKQAEELLETISLNSPASIFVIQNDKFQFVNPRMIETIGYTEAELMEMDTDKIIHPEDRQKVREEVTKALKGEQPLSCEYRGVRKDGKIIWYMGSIDLIQYRGRRAILGTVVDITMQKKAEETLKGSETKYHELVNIITSGVVVYQAVDDGEDFVFVDFNDAAEKIEKISREEILGKKVTEVFPGVKEFGLFDVFQKVWKTGNYAYYPSAMYKDEGDPGTWRENWVYKLPGGEIVAVYNDITEHKLAGKEVEMLVRLSSENPNPIMRISRDGVILYANHESAPLLEMWGCETGSTLPEKWHKTVADMLVSGTQWETEVEYKNLTYSLVFVPVKGTDYLNIYGSDITNRKRAETALRMSEINFRNSLDASPLGVRIITADGETIYANQAMLDIYGFKNLKELRDKSVEERYTPESYQIFLKRREKRLRNEYVPSKYEVSIIRKDGSIRQLEVFRKKVLWGGEPQFEVIYNDVTEQKQAEEAIHASELRYRRLFESAPQDGILIVNAKTRLIIDVNPFLTELVGFPREKLIGKELWEIGVLKDMIASKANFEELLRERYIRYDDLPLKTADGRQIAVEFISNVYEVGIDKLIQCNIRDITERKKAELALKESEKKYRELVETAQEGILVSDADSKITFVNQRICEMQGYTETELVGKYAYAFLDEKGRETFIHDIEGRRLGIKGEYDTQILHKDGSLIHVRVGSTPLYDNEGKYAGVMSVIVDISGLKNAEKHILHLNSVLNALRGINQLITLEKDRGILLQKSCDLLVNARGYDNAWVALTDGNGKFVSGVSSGISSKIFTPILQDFSKGKYPPCSGDLLQQKENIILCPQFGSQHADCPFEGLGDNPGNLSGRLEYEGRLYGVLSVQLPSKLAGNKEEQGLFNELTNDIAFALDRLAKAQQLEEAETQARETEKLRAIDRLRSELLANVSHELRTPLSAIKGFTSTMLRKDVKWSAKQREDFLQTMDQETDRLTRLISDILDMSRLDAGAMKLKQGKYLVSEIVGSVKGRLEVLTAHHRLEINVPEKLPAIFVDEMRIGQVISNLVENAVKFSPAGSVINITGRLEKMNIVVSVIDHGEGMPKEVTEKLFNRFYQAEDVVTGRRSGTGLGLAICRGIIENHGGKIWVESKVKEGSKFSFSLPIIEEKTND